MGEIMTILEIKIEFQQRINLVLLSNQLLIKTQPSQPVQIYICYSGYGCALVWTFADILLHY